MTVVADDVRRRVSMMKVDVYFIVYMFFFCCVCVSVGRVFSIRFPFVKATVSLTFVKLKKKKEQQKRRRIKREAAGMKRDMCEEKMKEGTTGGGGCGGGGES